MGPDRFARLRKLKLIHLRPEVGKQSKSFSLVTQPPREVGDGPGFARAQETSDHNVTHFSGRIEKWKARCFVGWHRVILIQDPDMARLTLRDGTDLDSKKGELALGARRGPISFWTFQCR